MKKMLVWLLCVLMMLSLVGCSSKQPEKPETNLDFWIADNVDAVDFSEYQERYGMYGGRQYYGKGYVPTVDENGTRHDPEECVIYTVTSYPDYISRNKHITRITITDPNVTVYGLTINSSKEDIEETMKDNGFKSAAFGDNGNVEWVKGKFHIRFSGGTITIKVDVSNFLKIKF